MERVNGYSMLEVLWTMVTAAAAKVSAALRAYAETRAREAVVRELERLNDHMLRDIGLHRSQIRAYVRKGLWW